VLDFQLPRPYGGAIDVRDIHGFSHINKNYGTFLDWTH
jgi:hypothetical protein